ncbi:hypothetical protein ES332_D10G001000v1 [Gossypium tomentosum]|uniref:TFIIS N-terminal domain-containing protein n=1 Tax=Gossypium tomentosum TaxID=34277 RepID=A0A5D2IXT2_GOSTO|nr:hypothetical protein ES332_D10G001000v1 [Gossypium tomentosum]
MTESCLTLFVNALGLLLTLLQALDKLPVNLTVLQMCSIGKSMNLLRTHRNIEIQKKARSLVDTWKKKIQVELDAKYGPNQSVPWSDVAKCGIKHYRPSEVAVKSSATQFSATKTGFVKLFQGGTATKSASAMPVPMKASTLPASARTKARNATIVGTSDPQTTTRDEKIKSSSQSHNNTLSCSSDHAKMGEIPVKEDARSSAAGSGTVTKISGSSSRHWKFINGLPGPLGVQRETGPCNNSSLHRNSAPGKVPQSSLTCEKAVDALIAEGNGFLEDQLVTNSRASSPVLSEKQEQFKHNMKEKSGTYQENVMTDVNNESWQSNDVKDLLTGSDEGESSPAAVPDEEYCRTGEDLKKITEVTKVASSSSNACMPVADGAGMNLLACVAAGEIPKSDVASAIDSPQRNENRRR